MSEFDPRSPASSAGWSRAYLVVVGLASATYFLPGLAHDAAMVLYLVIIATTPLAIVAGVRLHRPRPSGPWLLLAAGLAAIVAGDVAWTIDDLWPELHLRSVAIAELGYVTGYLLITGALLGVVRARLPGRDRDTVLDATIVATGASLLTWTLIVAPAASDTSLSLIEVSAAVSQPLIVVLPLAVVVRLLLITERLTMVLAVLVAGTAAWFVADTAYSVQALNDSYTARGWVDFGWLVGNLSWAAVALHPAMRSLTERTAPRSPDTGTARLALLASAALIAPLLLVVEVRSGASDLNLLVLAAGAALLFLLVIGRLDGLNHRLAHQAGHDALTGLPNRVTVLARLERALARSRRSGHLVAVLFVDLDRFKQVNDSLGHRAGDDVLCAVADRLVAGSRETDTVARFGGDEFIIICEDLERAEQAHVVADRVLEELTRPLLVHDTPWYVSGSIGVAIADAAHCDAHEVLRDADTAVYRAKDAGRGRFVVFDQTARDETLRRSWIERELHHALDSDALEVHFQPVVHLASDAIVGFEALVRWWHPERGLIPPDEFLEVAEDTGLIVAMGDRVLSIAIDQLGRWHRAGATAIQVAVNLSPRELLVPDLVDRVADRLARAGVAPDRLCIEATEGAVFRDLATAGQVMASLRALGVQLAIDDFGTGYSSLTYLRELPVQVVKLDRSFLASVSDDPVATSIVTAVVEMADAAGLTVIAEGIETPEQRDLLQRLGCRFGQGFLWSPAVPAEDATELIVRRFVDPDHARRPVPLA